jgi:hypothetical protein
MLFKTSTFYEMHEIPPETLDYFQTSLKNVSYSIFLQFYTHFLDWRSHRNRKLVSWLVWTIIVSCSGHHLWPKFSTHDLLELPTHRKVECSNFASLVLGRHRLVSYLFVARSYGEAGRIRNSYG